MRSSLLPEKISVPLRLFIAQAVTVMFLIMALMSFSIPYASSIRPEFLVMLVYYWAVYRPTLIAPMFVFFLGIMMDILLGLPIGLNVIALLAVQWLIQRQRLFLMGQSFIGLWLGFMVAVSAVVFFKWFVMSLLELTILPAGPALASILTSIFLFPLISLFLLGVHKILPVTD